MELAHFKSTVVVKSTVPGHVFFFGTRPFFQCMPHVLGQIPVGRRHVGFQLIDGLDADNHRGDKLLPQGPCDGQFFAGDPAFFGDICDDVGSPVTVGMPEPWTIHLGAKESAGALPRFFLPPIFTGQQAAAKRTEAGDADAGIDGSRDGFPFQLPVNQTVDVLSGNHFF